MARAVGHLETFYPKRHNFPKYVQRVKLYFTANDNLNARRKSVFLSALGYETYDILANVFDDPEAQTFNTLVERLKNHFHPKSSVAAKRYKFGCRRQGDSESTADFVADLRSLGSL
uniref:Retrotransposon gag domain-containing protein n=1 Tax=Amphimedon queenslandica TaxID=400682 RepID=A0A1X7U2S7_AMPQE